MVVFVCNPSYLGGASRRITNSRPVQAKLAKPYLKKKKGRVFLPLKGRKVEHKVLCSIFSNKKKQKTE
jgi:hypothetical protein